MKYYLKPQIKQSGHEQVFGVPTVTDTLLSCLLCLQPLRLFTLKKLLSEFQSDSKLVDCELSLPFPSFNRSI